MKYFLSIILSIFISSNGYSHSPTDPYTFYEPNIEKLIPFSSNQLKKIKLKRVKTVKTFVDNDSKNYILYLFDETGKLIQENYVGIIKNKEIQYTKTNYRYNNMNLLISKCKYKLVNKVEILEFDSLNYNHDGRLTYYYSYINYIHPKNRKRQLKKNVNHQMKFIGSNNGIYILVDSVNVHAPTKYFFNLDNKVIKRDGFYQIDTVIFKKLNDSSISGEYFYKTLRDTSLKLGKQVTYSNLQITFEAIYEKIYNGDKIHCKRYFFYDTEGKLLRIDCTNKIEPRYFFTYKYGDLVSEEIRLKNGIAEVNSYFYTFWK